MQRWWLPMIPNPSCQRPLWLSVNPELNQGLPLLWLVKSRRTDMKQTHISEYMRGSAILLMVSWVVSLLECRQNSWIGELIWSWYKAEQAAEELHYIFRTTVQTITCNHLVPCHNISHLVRPSVLILALVWECKRDRFLQFYVTSWFRLFVIQKLPDQWLDYHVDNSNSTKAVDFISKRGRHCIAWWWTLLVLRTIFY